MHWYNLRWGSRDGREFMSEKRLLPGDELALNGLAWRVIAVEPADPAYEATVHIEPVSRDHR